MKKNVGSQFVSAQLVSKTDGSDVTSGSTTVSVTGDGGSRATGSVGSGAATHKGGGLWEYAPAQAETNFDHVSFQFANSTAVTAAVHYDTSFPQTGDSFARIGAPVGGSISIDVAAVKTDTAAIKTKTDFLPSATAGAAGGVFIAGTNAATSVTTALTANVIGNVTGNLSGSVGSVTARVTANTDQLAGQTVSAAAGVTFPASVASPTNITAGTITTVTNLTNAATNGDLTATMKASVNTEADTALADYDAPTNAEMVARTLAAASYATAAAQAVAQAILDKLNTTMESVGSPTDFVFTTRALAQAPGAGSAPSAAAIADAVWDEILAGHLGAGSTGASLNNASSAGNPWSSIITGAYTAEDILRIIVAVLAGLDTQTNNGGGSATVTFKDIGDNSTIVQAAMLNSVRTAVVLTP